MLSIDKYSISNKSDCVKKKGKEKEREERGKKEGERRRNRNFESPLTSFVSTFFAYL
jgi:hypothetical protein